MQVDFGFGGNFLEGTVLAEPCIAQSRPWTRRSQTTASFCLYRTPAARPSDCDIDSYSTNNMNFRFTRGAKPTLIAIALCLAAAALGSAKNFSGADAFAFTRQAVALGPRPDGSPAIAKLRTMIKEQLAMRGCEVILDKFTAQTPDGPVAMENI